MHAHMSNTCSEQALCVVVGGVCVYLFTGSREYHSFVYIQYWIAQYTTHFTTLDTAWVDQHASLHTAHHVSTVLARSTRFGAIPIAACKGGWTGYFSPYKSLYIMLTTITGHHMQLNYVLYRAGIISLTTGRATHTIHKQIIDRLTCKWAYLCVFSFLSLQF